MIAWFKRRRELVADMQQALELATRFHAIADAHATELSAARNTNVAMWRIVGRLQQLTSTLRVARGFEEEIFELADEMFSLAIELVDLAREREA